MTNTPIYTDKDYLDAQFSSVNVQLGHMNKRMDDHEERHKEEQNRWIKLAGMVIGAAGVVATLLGMK